MENIYQEMQGVATEVIGEFKQGVSQYVHVTPGAGPVDNPGTAVETAYDINSVARGVSFKYIDGTNIVASDLQLVMPVIAVVPNMKGFIKLDGVRYKIVKIMVIPPAGTTVAYRIVFRK